MGACFTVNLGLTFLDEAAAVKAMQEYIHTANADFGLEKHKKRSVGTDKSEDLIKICFSSYHRFSWKCRTVYSRLLNKEGPSLYRDGLFLRFLNRTYRCD